MVSNIQERRRDRDLYRIFPLTNKCVDSRPTLQKTPVNGLPFIHLITLLIMNIFQYPSGNPESVYQTQKSSKHHFTRAFYAALDLKNSIESEAGIALRKLTPNHAKIILNELEHVLANLRIMQEKLIEESVEAREQV